MFNVLKLTNSINSVWSLLGFDMNSFKRTVPKGKRTSIRTVSALLVILPSFNTSKAKKRTFSPGGRGGIINVAKIVSPGIGIETTVLANSSSLYSIYISPEKAFCPILVTGMSNSIESVFDGIIGSSLIFSKTMAPS